jgi:hypothetical protein
LKAAEVEQGSTRHGVNEYVEIACFGVWTNGSEYAQVPRAILLHEVSNLAPMNVKKSQLERFQRFSLFPIPSHLGKSVPVSLTIRRGGMRRLAGAIIFLAGIAILLVLGGHIPSACERNPSFMLKGTVDDCAAGNPTPKAALPGDGSVLARTE